MADAKEMDSIDEKSKLNMEQDGAKIKFQPSKNGEAKVEMPDSGSGGGNGYQCGLTKEELMKYANDPFWVALRRILFVLFWVLWIAMLVGAVAIIIVTPKCAAPKEPEWYESSPIYELRVDLFMDGDGDGSSDLKGINEKLPYLDEISVSALVFDGLFNTQDQRIINPQLGSFEDFSSLAQKKKVLLRIPLSGVGLDSDQKESEFMQSLRFWLEKGAAGFVFDEVELVPDFTDRLGKLAPEWNRMIQNFSTEDFPRISILSSYEAPLSDELCSHASMILDYRLIKSLSSGFTADQLAAVFGHTAENQTSSCRSNIVLGNGDIKSLTGRFSNAERDRLIMFSLLADATPFVYFGDEWGNSESPLPVTLTRGHGLNPLPMDWKTVDTVKSAALNNFYNVFKTAAKLRKDQYAIRMGETALKVLGTSADIVAMSRVKKGNPGFIVVANLSPAAQVVDLSQLGDHIPETGHVDFVSSNTERNKEKVYLKSLELAAEETLVLQFVPILG